MKRNYPQNVILSFLTAVVLLCSAMGLAQAPRIFTVQDFELTGKVKSCQVITPYGKETFEFNEAGLLTKSITSFNEQDYDITYYKYQGEELSERRDEIYRDGVFDKSVSMAHLYHIDTTSTKKITEKIVTYDEDFIDKYEYQYNLEDRLVKVIRSNNEGLDETLIEYTNYKSENTVTHYLNGVIQKSVRTSDNKKKNSDKQKIELIKEFLEGLPVKAIENSYDAQGKLLSQQYFVYDNQKKSFTPDQLISYNYDEMGRLIGKLTEANGITNEQEFIYQFDNGESGNWVKKIVTPENAFTTRKIAYYPEETEVDE
ncbi:hypothetical protein [Muriicola sp. Z0-33]|uniref:hypothetical protein n=1 Tax=Muriicola sp. Z0-33 TaxID=2816957 RepID=UPI00223724E7|nr:hypothetical protein [Muriicola sp. Z0-33]MCW5516594.1 hypothetical protein [Muriicola sp. Z0-33]